MTEIIFKKNKINSANEFVKIFNDTSNILVITGKTIRFDLIRAIE